MITFTISYVFDLSSARKLNEGSSNNLRRGRIVYALKQNSCVTFILMWTCFFYFFFRLCLRLIVVTITSRKMMIFTQFSVGIVASRGIV